MKTVSMSGSRRENVGKKDAKLCRAQGKVPCVLYGGKEEIHFTVTVKDLKPVIFTPYVHIIDLSIDGTVHHSIIQAAQYHPVTDEALHLDFLELKPGKPVIVSLPIQTVGNSKGVLRGGKLVKKFRKLRVKGLIENLPELIDVDITELDILDDIKISDLNIKEMEVLEVPTSVVCMVISTRALAAAESAS